MDGCIITLTIWDLLAGIGVSWSQHNSRKRHATALCQGVTYPRMAVLDFEFHWFVVQIFEEIQVGEDQMIDLFEFQSFCVKLSGSDGH